MTTPSLVLAHQGGWDEILLVLTPVSLFAGLLWLANRRANAQASTRAGEADDERDEPSTSPEPELPPDRSDPPGGPTT